MAVIRTRALAFVAMAIAIIAHPLGNFTINHYTRIQPSGKGVEITYLLDLAELPASMLLKDWKLDAASPLPDLRAKAMEQAREWAKRLAVLVDGAPAEVA